ncbi:MAG: hypothetical protein IMF06_00280, partial [Proteobacteria bacterium]|nr:hypothetical protein [Pseudomonadota bacterium]
EQAARQKALEEEQRKKAAKKAARQKALKIEAKKKAAEEAARIKAEKLAERKIAQEKAAKLRAELAEQKRRHAEEAAQARADEKRIEDELRTLAAVQQAEEAAQAAALKEEQQRKEKRKAQAKAAAERRTKLAREKAAKLRTQEQQEEQAALDRAAEGSARLEQLQQVARPKTPPSPTSMQELAQSLPRRQPGAPNLFNLKPFRNTAAIRARAEKSQKLMKTLYIASVATLLALLLLGLRYALLPTEDNLLNGAETIVMDGHSGLIIQAGSRLFSLDRSGADTGSYAMDDLGITVPARLLGVDTHGRIILREKVDAAEGRTWPTKRCDLENRQCLPYGLDILGGRISAYVVDPRTGESYLVSPTEGLLIKLDGDGQLLAQKKMALPQKASLALHEGLLFMSSATGPAISIFRPDNKGFGEQLDEVLLLPAPAQEKKQTRIDQFLWAADSWWVVMTNTETAQSGLYRFDAKWNFLAAVALTPGSSPQQLLNWANKILVLDSEQIAIQRFNAVGKAEAPLVPTALQAYVENEQKRAVRSQKLWQLSLGLLALAGIGSYLLGRIHQLRSLVYETDKVRGAQPIDDKEQSIHWIGPETDRNTSFKKIAVLYSLICLSILTLVFIQALPLSVMLATSSLLAGPGTALALLWRSDKGHIGVFKDQLILVDQHHMYHMGSGARVHYRNNFLLLDDIVVFIGTRRLPVFSTTQLTKNVVPMALAGVKVDRKTVVTKLIQSSHALAKGLFACVAGMVVAIMCLLL